MCNIILQCLKSKNSATVNYDKKTVSQSITMKLLQLLIKYVEFMISPENQITNTRIYSVHNNMYQNPYSYFSHATVAYNTIHSKTLSKNDQSSMTMTAMFLFLQRGKWHSAETKNVSALCRLHRLCATYSDRTNCSNDCDKKYNYKK